VRSNIAGAVFRAEKLMEDAVFDITNPNKIRAVIGAFIGNSVQFNSKDGSGYTFLADKVLKIDKINPLIAAALAKGFKKYAKLDDTRKGLMKEQLKKILATKGLSSNTYEITSQCYG
ncbi:MAG: aminopeptidase N C-terminal domain-containing protein, partial [Waddliaceae bacterium]|nr:aminopeptidase N C-terminal domain-containing protein [Waddliaceae bacterium]